MRTITRKRLTRLTVAAVATAGLASIAGTAEAQRPRQGDVPATCDMEVDGKTVQVPEGSRVGLLYCGTDGEWHLGWLVDAHAAGADLTTTPTTATPTTPPVKTATLAARTAGVLTR